MRTRHEAYWEGYRSKKAEIAERGFIAARDEFNARHPRGKPASLEDYYCAEGELQALVENLLRIRT